MRFDVLTLFPEIFQGYFSQSILKLALDAGLVEIARPALEPQRNEILRNYPWTKSLLSLVVRMAREMVG